MTRTPAKTPPNTPKRRWAINQGASVTYNEMAERMLQLEHNYEELTEQMLHISGDVESKLPSVTVSLLDDVMEGTRADMASVIQELSEVKAQLKNVTNDLSLGKHQEEDLHARIDRLESEKETLREAKHRLEKALEEDVNKAKLMEDEVKAMQVKSGMLRTELCKTLRTFRPLLQRTADRLESEKETTRKSNHRLEREHEKGDEGADELLESVIQQMARLK